MARAVRQSLPQPPPVYDPAYIAQLTAAINRYTFQREALGEITSARYIMTDPPVVASISPVPPGQFPSTAQLPTGTLYLIDPATAPAGTRFLAVVTDQDV